MLKQLWQKLGRWVLPDGGKDGLDVMPYRVVVVPSKRWRLMLNQWNGVELAEKIH